MGAPGTNWGARRAERFPQLRNNTLTPGVHPTLYDCEHHIPTIGCIITSTKSKY